MMFRSKTSWVLIAGIVLALACALWLFPAKTQAPQVSVPMETPASTPVKTPAATPDERTAPSRYANADALFLYKSPDVSDTSNTEGLLRALCYGDNLFKVSVQSGTMPYGIRVEYDFTKIAEDPERDTALWRDNAAVLFALIDNMDVVEFASKDRNEEWTKGYEAVSNFVFFRAARAEMEAQVKGDMRGYAADKAAFAHWTSSVLPSLPAPEQAALPEPPQRKYEPSYEQAPTPEPSIAAAPLPPQAEYTHPISVSCSESMEKKLLEILRNDKTVAEQVVFHGYNDFESGEKLYFGELFEGYFSNSGKPEKLALFNVGTSHAGGDDAHVVAVFNEAGDKLISARRFSDDDFVYRFFTGDNHQTRFLHAGTWSSSDLYEECNLGFYDMTRWKQLLPHPYKRATDVMIRLRADGTVVVDKYIEDKSGYQLSAFMPEWVYEFDPKTNNMKKAAATQRDKIYFYSYAGFSIFLPESWKDQYTFTYNLGIWGWLDMNGGILNYYHEIYYFFAKDFPGTPIFSIRTADIEKTMLMPDMIFLGYTDWYPPRAVFLEIPRSLLDDPEKMPEIQRMREDIPAIISSFVNDDNDFLNRRIWENEAS